MPADHIGNPKCIVEQLAVGGAVGGCCGWHFCSRVFYTDTDFPLLFDFYLLAI